MSPLLDLLVELVFAAIEFVDVALVEEQLQRVEIFDERFQRSLGDLVVDPLTGEVVALHQRGDRERDLPVVLRWAGSAWRKAAGCWRPTRRQRPQPG